MSSRITKKMSLRLAFAIGVTAISAAVVFDDAHAQTQCFVLNEYQGSDFIAGWVYNFGDPSWYNPTIRTDPSQVGYEEVPCNDAFTAIVRSECARYSHEHADALCDRALAHIAERGHSGHSEQTAGGATRPDQPSGLPDTILLPEEPREHASPQSPDSRRTGMGPARPAEDGYRDPGAAPTAACAEERRQIQARMAELEAQAARGVLGICGTHRATAEIMTRAAAHLRRCPTADPTGEQAREYDRAAAISREGASLSCG